LGIAIEFENVLLQKKYLKSVSKRGYELFFSQYLSGNSSIDMERIYQIQPLFITLTYPSTLSRSWYIFDEIIRKSNSEFQNKSTLVELHSILGEILQEFDFKQDNFEKYLRTLSDQDFEEKEIYRIPLLIFFYNYLFLIN
jgi:hypothetical protein